jgi:hypothetical protein
MKLRPVVILLCLYFFHIINNYVWLRLDTTYLVFDPAQYHLYSLGFFEAIKNSLSATLFSKDIFRNFSYRSGPLAGLITAPFYFFFGVSQDTAVMISSVIFLAILLFSVYGIGRKLADERIGLLGAFIVSMYPIIFNQLRVYMYDLPLSALVSLNIYLLIRTDYFRNRFFTALYALTMVLGALIKFNFFVFIIGPLFLVLCKTPAEIKKSRNKSQLSESQRITILREKRPVILLVMAAFIIISFGYRSLKLLFLHSSVVSWLDSIKYLSAGNFGGKVVSLAVLWVNSFLFFLATFTNEAVSLFFLSIFAVGLIVVLRIRFKYTVFLLLPVLIPLFFTIFVFNTFGNTARYMLPSYVCIALISALGVMNIKTVNLRRIILILIVLVGFMQYFAVSYGFGFLPKEIRIDLPEPLKLHSPVFLKKAPLLKTAYFYMRPNNYFERIILLQQEIPIFPDKHSSFPQKDCQNRQIVDEIINSCPLRKGDSFIFLGYNYDIGDILSPLRLEAFRKTKDTEIIKGPIFIEENPPLNQYMLTADYIAVMEGMRKESDLILLPDLIERIQKTKEYFYNHLYAFREAYKVNLSDGRKLSVYKNISNNIIEGPLEIKIRNGYANIFYLGKEVTEDKGLSVYFTYNHKTYFSYEAISEIQKPAANCVLIRLNWSGLDVTQVWEFTLQDGRINWRIYLDSPKKLLLQGFQIKFHLSPVYQNWQDYVGAGFFHKPKFPWLENSQVIRRKMLSGSALAIEPVNFPKKELPGILLRNLCGIPKTIDIYSGSFNRERVCVFYIDSLPLEPGLAGNKFLLFSGQLSLFTDAAETKDKDVLIHQEGGYEN